MVLIKSDGVVMSVIEVSYIGDHDETTRALRNLKGKNWVKMLAKYGEAGVIALQNATPIDTGKTAASWGYTIELPEPGKIRLVFTNSNVVNDWANVAILLQYGHATRNGGWVEGRDYINPAIQPIFDRIADQAWKEVQNV